jgi:D-alanyl-D-alanine dipeptidase
MKIVISLVVLVVLVLAGTAGYLMYGFVVDLNTMTNSEQGSATEAFKDGVEGVGSVADVAEGAEGVADVEDVPGVTEGADVTSPEEVQTASLEGVSDHELVSVEKYSTIKTSNYFKTNKIFVFTEHGTEEIYANSDDIFLKAGTLRKLIQVDEALKNRGYNLVIWIGYRDEELQRQLREHLEITMGISEGRYDLVSKPGTSYHQKGTAVDVTLERIDGDSLEMPSAYLDFTDNRLPSLHKNHEALQVLQEAMVANKMEVYKGEWWHFNDSIKEYKELP